MNTTQTITGMLFMRTLTFWFIIALCSFLFITFIHYKNCERTKKPLNLIFLAILFVIIFSLTGGTWYYCIGRHPKLATQAKNSVVKTTQTVKDWNNKRKKDKDSEPTKKDDTPEDAPSNSKGKNLLDKAKDKIADKIDDIKENQAKKAEEKITNPVTTKDYIAKANQEIADLRKEYAKDYELLKAGLQEINDNIIKQTANLEKTKLEEAKIKNLIKTNDDLLKKVKTELETARREKLDHDLQIQFINGEIELEEAELRQDKINKQKLLEEVNKVENDKNDKKSEAKILAIEEEIKKIDTTITKHETNIITLNATRGKKMSQLAKREGDIKRFNEYMKTLEEIRENYKKSMNEILKDKTTQTEILKTFDDQEQLLKDEMELIAEQKEILNQQAKFYNFLNESINKAQIANAIQKNQHKNKPIEVDFNKAIDVGATALGSYGEIVHVAKQATGIVDAFNQMNIRHKVADAEATDKINRINEAKAKRENDQLYEDVAAINRRKAMKEEIKTLETKYQSLFYQLYDKDGNIKPIDEKTAVSLKKQFADELANEQKKFKEISKSTNKEIDKILEDRRAKQIELTKNNKDENTILAEELKLMSETVVKISEELKNIQGNENVTQTEINKISQEILEEQIQEWKLIKQKDELNNRSISSIEMDDKNIRQYEQELVKVNEQLSPFNNNANSNN